MIDKSARVKLVRRVEETYNDYAAAVKRLHAFDDAPILAAHEKFKAARASYLEAVRAAGKLPPTSMFSYYNSF